MEFDFDLWQAFKTDDDRICVLDGMMKVAPKSMYGSTTTNQAEVINKMGAASASIQQLKQIITTADRFFGYSQRLYIKVDGKKCLGILKVGEKNLFYRDGMGSIKELKPLCVLDFYVHESVQRGGIGKELFKKMLSVEQKEPKHLAYDRPSSNLIGFLKKHYQLVHYTPQNNNFVIFQQYFQGGQMQQAALPPQSEQRQFQNTGRQIMQNYTPKSTNDLTSGRLQVQARSSSTMYRGAPYATYTDESIQQTEKELNFINKKLLQLQQPYTSFKPPQQFRAPWALDAHEPIQPQQKRQQQHHKTGFN